MDPRERARETEARWWDATAGDTHTDREACRKILARAIEAAEREALKERDEARALAEEACAKHNALLEDRRVLRCAFCDAEYPPGTPATQHATLTAHIMECPKHPMRAAERDARRVALEEAADEIDAMSAAITPNMGSANGGIMKDGIVSWLRKRAALTLATHCCNYHKAGGGRARDCGPDDPVRFAAPEQGARQEEQAHE